MTLDVKFEEQDQTFSTNFGEIQTVSDGGFERGYTEGYTQGEVEGYDKGKTDGLVDGYDKGKTDGLVEGYDKGKTDGRVEGEQVGFDNAVSKLTTLEVTENGEYTPSDDNIGFNKVTVNIGGEEKSKFAQRVDGTLTEVTANDLKGITNMKDYAFYECFYLTNITIPDSVTSIGIYAFYNCDRLRNIDIPNSITTISRYAFSEASLLSVKLPNALKIISSGVFRSCILLESVQIPNGVETIESMAFYGCGKLTSITIPSSVTKIDGYALQIGNSANKATITFLGTTPPTINSSTFEKNRIEKIIVPKGSLDAYKSATNWSKYADIMEEATE